MGNIIPALKNWNKISTILHGFWDETQYTTGMFIVQFCSYKYICFTSNLGLLGRFHKYGSWSLKIVRMFRNHKIVLKTESFRR